MASARETALRTLMACQRQGAWSDGYLKKAIREDGLDRRDAALATRLCFGVLQNQLRLDWYLAQFSRIPLDKLEGAVLCSLRLALYQIQEMDRVPDSAAVNEAVKLTRKHRIDIRIGRGWSTQCCAPICASGTNCRSRQARPGRRRCPSGIATLSGWSRALRPGWAGRGQKHCWDADDQQPPTTVQVNALQVSPGQALESLQAQGVQAEVHPWLPGCLVLRGPEIWKNWKPTKRDGFTSRMRLPVWLCWRQDQKQGSGAGLLCRPGREVLCLCHPDGGSGRGGVLRHPPPQDQATGGGQGQAWFPQSAAPAAKCGPGQTRMAGEL